MKQLDIKKDFVGGFRPSTRCSAPLEKVISALFMPVPKLARRLFWQAKLPTGQNRPTSRSYGLILRNKARRSKYVYTKLLWDVTSHNYTPTDLVHMNSLLRTLKAT